VNQQDQDTADEENQREAVLTLVQTWLERLRLISVIVSCQRPTKNIDSGTMFMQTTFFASLESGLLGRTIPSSNKILSGAGLLSNICFMGALVIHTHAGESSFAILTFQRRFISLAAIISFLGAFFLVRYKLAVAQKEEKEAEIERINSPISISSTENARGSATSPDADDLRKNPVSGRARVNSLFSGDQIIWTTHPHLVQVGPFQRQAPTELLARCHALCLFLSFLGFVLTLIGLISFAWDQLPLSVSAFASASMGFCWVAVILIIITPSTKASHIYYDRKSR